MDFEIRPLQSQEDFQACLSLQDKIWGMGSGEAVPPTMLKIAQKVGGIVAGAFHPDGGLLGFVYGVPGWSDGRQQHWSHMLAVHPDHRDLGIGQALKRHQRELLLAAGALSLRWTYDPLVARNAHMNLVKLGARVLEYLPDAYIPDEKSHTDSIIGTDRFVVEDALTKRSPREGETSDRDGVRPINLRSDASGQPVPHAADLPDAPLIHVAIPNDIQSLKLVEPDLARLWRSTTRTVFQHYIGRGYEVSGFGGERLPGGEGVYTLSASVTRE